MRIDKMIVKGDALILYQILSNKRKLVVGQSAACKKTINLIYIRSTKFK